MAECGGRFIRDGGELSDCKRNAQMLQGFALQRLRSHPQIAGKSGWRNPYKLQGLLADYIKLTNSEYRRSNGDSLGQYQALLRDRLIR
ncbi:hypothetical protein NDU88_001860 [Pleurodeles waltl]|uniref:Uncharacterized protein n=1 Tax=Pleurodeles waltl TaxID=8319 RepID=A0AAV7NC03_PLEWA|nr:hypothetical protein NDU88_001860 [Pleurodeles waltl]